MESNKLINKNGQYKDKASITEIAKRWCAINYKKVSLLLLREAVNGKLRYNFPKGIYNEIESLSLNNINFRCCDLDNYLMVIESYIKERIIYESFEGEIPPFKYKKALKNLSDIDSSNLSIWAGLCPIIKSQRCIIFPKYKRDKHPCEDELFISGRGFYNWYNKLDKDVKEYIESNISPREQIDNHGVMSYEKPASPKKLNVGDVLITKEAAISLLRYLSFSNTRNDTRALLLNCLLFGRGNFDIKITETGESLKQITKSIFKKFENNSKQFRLELCNYLFFTQDSMNRWLRRNASLRGETYPGNIEFPEGNLNFWGGQFFNTPQSYKLENEDAKEHNLYDAIKYWSDPEDIRDLEVKWFRCSKSKTYSSCLPLNFQKINHNDNTVFDDVRKYNDLLELIINKFINHIIEGRLVVKGIEKGKTKTDVIDKGYFKKLARNSKIDWIEGETKDGLYIGVDVVKNDGIRMATIEKNLKALVNNYKGTKITRDGLIELFDESFPQHKNVLTRDTEAFRRAWKLLNSDYKFKGAPKKDGH